MRLISCSEYCTVVSSFFVALFYINRACFANSMPPYYTSYTETWMKEGLDELEELITPKRVAVSVVILVVLVFFP